MTVTLLGQLLDEHGAAIQISRHVVPSSNLRSPGVPNSILSIR